MGRMNIQLLAELAGLYAARQTITDRINMIEGGSGGTTVKKAVSRKRLQALAKARAALAAKRNAPTRKRKS